MSLKQIRDDAVRSALQKCADAGMHYGDTAIELGESYGYIKTLAMRLGVQFVRKPTAQGPIEGKKVGDVRTDMINGMYDYDIARKHGVSRERIRQIRLALQFVDDAIPDSKAPTRPLLITREELEEAVAAGETMRNFSKRTKISYQAIYKCEKKYGVLLKRMTPKPSGITVKIRAMIKAGMRNADISRELKVQPVTVSGLRVRMRRKDPTIPSSRDIKEQPNENAQVD